MYIMDEAYPIKYNFTGNSSVLPSLHSPHSFTLNLKPAELNKTVKKYIRWDKES